MSASDHHLSTPADLSRQLAERAEAVCRHYLPGGRIDGRVWRCGSVGGEAGDSLYVYVAGRRRGRWEDAARPGEHGDMLDLIRAARGFGGLGEAFSEARRFLGGAAAAVAPTVPAGTAGADPRKVRGLLRHGRGITDDDPSGRYLRARGLDPADARLSGVRFRPDAWAVVDGRRAVLPALLAPVRTAAQGEAAAVHVVFLTEAGLKSPVGKRTRGAPGTGAVWFPAGRSPRHVVLTEGVEDALSVVRVLTPAAREVTTVAASLSAARIARVELPPAAVSVTLIQDADPAGEAAWTALRKERAGTGLRIPQIRLQAGPERRSAGTWRGGLPGADHGSDRGGVATTTAPLRMSGAGPSHVPARLRGRKVGKGSGGRTQQGDDP